MNITELLNTTNNAASGTSDTSISANKLNNDIDDFLNLLVTQLQNQDPLEPVDSKDFTNQLIGFSQVEQQINQNAKLDNLVEAVGGSNLQGTLGYIGLDVTYEGDNFSYETGDYTIDYQLGENAAQSQISILDENGNILRTEDAPTGAGAHQFTWDGKDENGNIQPEGTYRISIAAVNGNGAGVDARTVLTGRVTGVETLNGEARIVLGGHHISENNILAVASN